jgi:hypothetical protein
MSKWNFFLAGKSNVVADPMADFEITSGLQLMYNHIKSPESLRSYT